MTASFAESSHLCGWEEIEWEAEYIPYFWKKGCDILCSMIYRGHGDSGGSYGARSIRARKDHNVFSKTLMNKSKLQSQSNWMELVNRGVLQRY